MLALAPETSDAARVVRRLGCGVVTDPDDHHAALAAVRQLARNRHSVARMGQLALEAAPDFARDKELQIFRRVVEDAA